MNTTGFLLVNASSRNAEFHVATDGGRHLQRYPVQPGAHTRVPTDATVARHDVYATVDGVASATLVSRNLNTTFTINDHAFWASDASPAQRRSLTAQERLDWSAQIKALGEARDMDAMASLAQQALQAWHRHETADPYALNALCTALASVDGGDWQAQTHLAQQCAIAALLRSERLSVLEEVSFAMRLTEPATGTQGLLPLAQRTGFWLRAWSRLQGAVDAGFDPADRPPLHVAPPASTGLMPGVAPDAVEDPALRAQYTRAIEDHHRAAANYCHQVQLRRAQAGMQVALQRYVMGAYARPRFHVDDLAALLGAHLAQEGGALRPADILSSVQQVVAHGHPDVQTLPSCEVRYQPRDHFVGRSLRQFGIGEEIDLSVDAGVALSSEALGGVAWRVADGDATLLYNDRDGHAIAKLGATAGTVSLVAKVVCGAFQGAEVGRVELVCAPPTGATMVQAAGTGISHTVGTWSVGFKGAIHLLPSNVSYAGVLFREGAAIATATNWLYRWNNLPHPVGQVHTVTGSVVDCVDSVDSGSQPPPYGIGEFNWPIPWEASIDNGLTWTAFVTANHHATSTGEGLATISKAGAGPYQKNAADPSSSTVVGSVVRATPHGALVN
ncbi:MAG: hypothetical protein QE265_03030 [Rhodoferax sp.]|nr:hypothetical protein [Rhodoferax sp.]